MTPLWLLSLLLWTARLLVGNVLSTPGCNAFPKSFSTCYCNRVISTKATCPQHWSNLTRVHRESHPYCYSHKHKVLVAKTSGKPISLVIKPSETLETIKHNIEEKAHISSVNQCLVSRGKELNNNHALADSHAKGLSLINVLLRLRGGMKIFVQTAIDKRIAMEVNASDTISMVLSKLEDMTAVITPAPCLTLRGTALEQGCSLSHYKIGNGTVLELVSSSTAKVFGYFCSYILLMSFLRLTVWRTYLFLNVVVLWSPR